MAKIDLMALEIENMVGSLKGQKILLYGDNDTGKTKQAMRMEKPLLLMCESGGNAVSGYRQAIATWDEFQQTVKQLTGDKTRSSMMEKFQTIIVDTVDMLVNYCEQSICNEFGVRDLSEMNADKDNPNGYLLARNDFKLQVNQLTKYGYTVVFIAHDDIMKYEQSDPETGKVVEKEFIIPFNTGNKKSSNKFVRDLCDFCFYVKPNGIDKSTGNPIPSTAYAKRTNSAFARCRYIHMQPIIDPFTAENISKAMLEAIEKEAAEGGVKVEEFKQKESKDTAKDYIDLIQPLFKELYSLYPDEVTSIVEAQLGEGSKISKATDKQVNELKTIYKNLNSLAVERKIEV